MSGIALIALIVVLLLAAVVFLAVTARKSDRNAATGLLARETVRKDRSRVREEKAAAKAAARAGTSVAPPVADGRDAERSVALARRGVSEIVEVQAPSLPDVIRPPMDYEQLGVSRRQFLNRGITGMMLLGLGGFGGSLLAFLWPSLGAGFGAKVAVGKLDDILTELSSAKAPKYVAEARSYIQAYPTEKGTLEKAKKIYSAGVYAGMENGLVGIYQKCVHLGCKVPWCESSQWFECPCHGSQYNRVGERKGGPAPRGLDRFDVSVTDGVVSVDTSGVRQGPADGTDTTGQTAEGPHCVGGKE
jgi:cytochrome b6-f complex iron-sulfur subunit